MPDIVNTLSTKAKRDKYRKATLDFTLENALVAEAICLVDKTDSFTIQSPYTSTPTVEMTALTGTYTPAAWTTTDDTLTVNQEVKVGEHIYQFENVISKFDVYEARVQRHNYAIAAKIDEFVLNNLCEDATGAYTTPVGGFTTVANVNVILANLISKVAGYATQYNDLFLVIENTDLTGFMQAQMTNGFSFADAALKNGFMTSQAGIDIYVVRTGTFKDATIGTIAVTNSGHRVFGVKNVATYASPRGLSFEEKGVSGKSGMEILTIGQIGFKLWAVNTDLVVDITLA